ncbi:unnamed protein product [Closterium sp. NIES-54]
MFPLDQNDWEQGISAPPSVTRPPTSLPAAADSAPAAARAASVVGAEAAPVGPKREYAPPHVLTLLFMDLGVLTPATVSDELIQLYLWPDHLPATAAHSFAHHNGKWRVMKLKYLPHRRFTDMNGRGLSPPLVDVELFSCVAPLFL